MSQANFYGPEWLSLGLWPMLTILPLIVWGLAWKGWALWLAARRGEMPWFVVLLLINTAGILEIIYIFVIAKRSDSREEVISIVPEDKTESK